MYLLIKKEFVSSYEGSSARTETIYGIFKNKENAEKLQKKLRNNLIITDIKEIESDF